MIAIRKDRECKSPRVLRTDSKGDRRFSALYAPLKVNGSVQMVEELYQTSKMCYFKAEDVAGDHVQLRAARTIREGRGKYPEYVLWGGTTVKNFSFIHPLLAPETSAVHREFYHLLWELYLLQNPSLRDVLEEYDAYEDTFGKEDAVCQAESFRAIMDGEESLFLDKPLVCPICEARKMVVAGHEPTRCYLCRHDFAGEAWVHMKKSVQDSHKTG